MIDQSIIPKIDFNFESISPLEIPSLETSTEGTKKVKDEENQTDTLQDKIEVKKKGKSSNLPEKTFMLSSSSASPTPSSTSISISAKSIGSHQHDPILRNEDGSMLTTPQNIPMVITKDQNKLIHLDPVPNFQDKSEIKPWLQKIFYPMGIEIVIERSDNTKVIFKCKASKRGRKSRKSVNNGTPNKTTSTFEDTVKECAEKFIIHDNVALQNQNSMNIKKANDSNILSNTSTIPQISINPSSSSSSQPTRVKKKRAVSRFNVCPFRIRATYSLKRHKWSIVVINNTHTHELTFNPDSEEYKKFKAKLREDNDIEAIKKFDELEYKKRSNLPIQTPMIPCECGLTNEIESFNIVIPNSNTIRATSTPNIFSNIPINNNYSHDNGNTASDFNTIHTRTINNNNNNNISNNKRKTISDLIKQKNQKNNNIEENKNSSSISNIPCIKVNNTNNISINQIPSQHKPIINNNSDWGIQEKFNSYSNVNPLYESLIGNDNNSGIFDDNHLGILYELNNNENHTEIIKAKEVIRDEENDEELGNNIQGMNDDYANNGNNNIVANEYYHNDFDSYNTDHFYKFNGPFDSGNIILTNDHNNIINSINDNHNPITTNIHNNMDTTTTNNNNTVNGNINIYDDLLLINNFIDDPVFNESHLNMMNLRTINLESQFNNNHNNNTSNNLIDLNEIDFTDIFINNGCNTTNKFTSKNSIAVKKEQDEHVREEENIEKSSQNPISSETIQNELNQFISNIK